MAKSRILLLSVFALLLLVGGLSRRANAQNLTLSVSPNDVVVPEAEIGQTFTVNVTIANSANVAGPQFRLGWSSTILRCESIVLPSGHFMDPMGVEEAAGNLWVLQLIKGTGFAAYAVTYQNLSAAQARGTAPRSGDGVLATLTFTSLTAGVTTIAFDNDPGTTLVGDMDGNAILPLDLVDGDVTVIPEFDVIILLAVFAAATVVAVALKKSRLKQWTVALK